MVGGEVINIVNTSEGTWVQCLDRTYAEDTCAVFVKDAKQMKIGDKLWWQGKRAFWTPVPGDGRRDIALEKLGYSNRRIPDEVMEKLG